MVHRPLRPLRRIHDLASRLRLLSRSARERAEAGLMVVEGPRLADEALRESIAIREAVISARLAAETAPASLARRLASAGVYPWVADDATLSWLSDAATPQGILLLVERPRRTAAAVAGAKGATLLLVAAGVQDPGNMGSLVRLADAAGAAGLVAAGGADPFGPKAVRASAGSIFRLPVARLDNEEELGPLLAALREARYTLAGAVARGGRDYRRAMPGPPLALVVGAEASGLPAAAHEMLDVRLSIPMNPRVESLNVAAAAAILLFAAAAGNVRSPRAASPPPPPRKRGSRPRGRGAARPSRSRGGGPSAG